MPITLSIMNDFRYNTMTLILEGASVPGELPCEAFIALLKNTLTCGMPQQLVLYNSVNKAIAEIAVTHYRGKLLVLAGEGIESSTMQTIINAALGNRYIYKLHLQDISGPILANIYEILVTDFLSKKSNIREIYCNNNATYAAKFTQFIQNIQRQEITALINGTRGIIRQKGKSLLATLSPTGANLIANKRDESLTTNNDQASTMHRVIPRNTK